MQTSTSPPRSRAPYLVGLVCLIPLVGAFAGLILLLLGIFKYRDKWLSLIGLFGILFTVGIYSFLFYEMKYGKLFREGFAEISQMQLNGLVKNIEFYKVQYGKYPDSLPQLLKEDPFTFITDAIQVNQQRENCYYQYQNLGEKYLLFSFGQDGIPKTADDLFPQITINDSTKIGLIRY